MSSKAVQELSDTLTRVKLEVRTELLGVGLTDEQLRMVSQQMARLCAAAVRLERAKGAQEIAGIVATHKVRESIQHMDDLLKKYSVEQQKAKR
jgi:hypothetical protein